MEKDLITKIRDIVAKKENVDEDNVRSLMILVRKMIDRMSQSTQIKFLTLKLFCNWVAHIEITQSNTGLRILAKINHTLVSIKSKNSTNIMEIRGGMSNAIGFSVLRKELKLFFQKFGIDDDLVATNDSWAVFLDYLIEIIRDVPLAFPSLSKLDKAKQRIYNEIARNPIKPGAGVISAQISLIKYPPPTNEIMCLTVKTEDTTTTIVPLLIDIRL